MLPNRKSAAPLNWWPVFEKHQFQKYHRRKHVWTFFNKDGTWWGLWLGGMCCRVCDFHGHRWNIIFIWRNHAWYHKGFWLQLQQCGVYWSYSVWNTIFCGHIDICSGKQSWMQVTFLKTYLFPILHDVILESFDTLEC